MKKNIKFLLIFISFIFILFGFYFAMVYYYQNCFTAGTWINGIYCTGKTVDEVNQELLKEVKNSEFIIYDSFGKQNIISLEGVDFTFDYKSQLMDFKNNQDPFFWWEGFINPKNNIIIPKLSFNDEKLLDSIKELHCVKENISKEKNVEIILTDEGYILYNGMEDVLDIELLYLEVVEKISNGIFEMNLEESNSYINLELTPQMQQTLSLWEKVEKFQVCNVTYDISGTMVPVSLKDSSLFILTDQDGNFVLDDAGNLLVDKQAINDYILFLSDSYDTYGKERKFKATCGIDVSIKGGTYGSRMLIEKESDYLLQAFSSKVKEIHKPSYKKRTENMGGELGNTYIEIDLTEQKLYYYEDGKLLVDTDVVTGNMKRGNATPEGVNYVYGKQRNRILRGDDYESFVKYWMPVTGNIGIHDASWRRKFGGNIYLTNGSHGCINTPYSDMKVLYEHVEIGVPVVMFYHE